MLSIAYLTSILSKRLPTTKALKFYHMAGAASNPLAAPYIGTHDGTFHCDDVAACFMLKQLDRFKDHQIVRTRDKQVLAGAEIIVDVGDELDVERLRLDHHQRSFNQTIKDYHPNLKTTNRDKPPRLSSAGLVFAVFGKDLIVKILELGSTYKQLTSADHINMVDRVYERAYVEYIEEIDAIDNGVEVAYCPSAGDQQVVYNYHINTGISSRIGRLNPIDDQTSADERLERFIKAMPVVGAEITEGIRYLGHTWWPAVQELKKQVLDRKQFEPSGHVLYLPKMISGWKQSLYDIEEELGIQGQVKFLIYQDCSKSQNWRCMTVPVSLKSFASRVPLKEEWRGKRDEELQRISGVGDATFVHMSGFTGGAKSEEGAKELVRLTLEACAKS